MEEKVRIQSISVLFIIFSFLSSINSSFAQSEKTIDYFKQNYEILRDKDESFIGIARRSEGLGPTTNLELSQKWFKFLWRNSSVTAKRSLPTELDNLNILQPKTEDLFAQTAMPLCRTNKKFYFYLHRALRDGSTAITGQILKLIPIAWLVAPINYIVGRIVDLVWERHRYHQEGLAYLLFKINSDQLGLKDVEVNRCLSSIQEAKHALYDVHLLLKAWKKWDSYGVDERKKLRAKAGENTRSQLKKYRSISGPVTETIYEVTTKKGNRFFGNFSRTAFWLTKKPSISFWNSAPFLISSYRWSFELIKFATSFIPLPIVPSILRSPFNRVYAQQVQQEGQLFVYWMLNENVAGARQLLKQSANPFILSID